MFLQLSLRGLMRSHSLALLSSIPPSYSGTVRQLSWRQLTRHLQLRANVLIVSRSTPDSSFSNAVALITLGPDLLPRQVNPYTVKVGRNTFVFALSSATVAFLQAAKKNIFKHSQKPNYTLVAPLTPGAKANLHLAARGSDRVDTSSAVCRTRATLLALKTISKNEALHSNNQLSQVVEERIALQMATASRSPFLTKLVHAFETNTTLNFATELAPLGDLERLLSKLPGRRLPEDVAKIIFSEILLALQDVHNLGLLFRDLKPRNVLFSATGHVRLSDFGLAKRIATLDKPQKRMSYSIDSFSELETEKDKHSGGEWNSTDGHIATDERTHTFVGTRLYMSPEHLRTGRKGFNEGYGRAADVWALGVTLYIMTTGLHPFASVADDTDTVESRIYNAELVEPTELSPELVSLLRGILCKDEYQRLELHEIMSSLWLKGVVWSDVRTFATEDFPVQPVLDLVHSAGVEGVADIVGHVGSGDDGVVRMKRLTKEMSAGRPRCSSPSGVRFSERARPVNTKWFGERRQDGTRWIQRLRSEGHLPGFGFSDEVPTRAWW